MDVSEATPSFREDPPGLRSHTPSSGISEGTFHSAVGSASLDRPEPPYTKCDSGCRDDSETKITDGDLSKHIMFRKERSPSEYNNVSSTAQNILPHQDVVQTDTIRDEKPQAGRKKSESGRDSAPSTRSNSRDHNTSKLPSSSRGSSHHRPKSRRSPSSTIPGSTTGTSRPSSKRSAKSSKRSLPSYSKPAGPIRSTSSRLPQRHAHNPFALHFKSCHLFQDITSHSFKDDGLTNNINNNLPALHTSSASLSGFSPVSRGLSATETYDAEQNEYFSSSSLPPVPQPTTIHWTSPSTLRREYAKIDRESRGIRGWWRRNAPGWCFKDYRGGFYDEEKDSDAGSVRRYRLQLPNDDEEEGSGGGGGDDDDHLIDEKDGVRVKIEVKSREQQRWLGRGWSSFKQRVL